MRASQLAQSSERVGSPTPASQHYRVENLADVSTRCSGLLHLRPEEDQSIWSKRRQSFQPCCEAGIGEPTLSTEQLLRIAFRIRTAYIDTNSQEYKEAKGAINAKTLEVRPKTTEKVFFLSVSDILVRLEDNGSRKEPFSPVYTHTIRYRFRTAPLRSPFLKTSVYQIVFVVCM